MRHATAHLERPEDITGEPPSRSAAEPTDESRLTTRAWGNFNAGLIPPHHNGRTEGVNTSTKKITRQMHGGAGFDLPRHRVLLQ
ncbi:hypothetical protein ABZ904_48830 [Streptomyces sp. NPDC046900]|uniref:hypothetical protein n=1 Tax=Streptomyces sp. NPDC046900 TaxID=3155473 RepID=UPI0033C0FDBA